jgi:pyruvate/2-oxoglutarate dehydrogenase complex dihydrolipoamide acyltransferase (E2) component
VSEGRDGGDPILSTAGSLPQFCQGEGLVWSVDGLARPGRDEEIAEEQANWALEKLNQGIRKTKQMVQLQTMKLAQEYFALSVETLEQQVKESRAALERLPEQVPWGQVESFQILFQELMDNYTTIEKSLHEAGENVANLDTEHLRKQGELDATDAARREARKRGVDLTEVEGTGSGGRIVVGDVRRAAIEAEQEANGERKPEETNATNAARQKAKELDIDLTEVGGTGYGGLVIMSDVLRNASKA